ncbi:MAG: CoA-binding protein [Methanobacteriota archaeon]|nr:MAG: CoA-binding protein [Euryarchaeota archaeon]
MDFFFNPKSVAVIGASTKPGKIGYEIVKSLLNSEFEGNVYPVHKRGEEIAGKTSYTSISELPSDVDLAVIALPSKLIPGMIGECAKVGVKGIVIVSGGFKELNEEGAAYEKEAVESARKNGIRIIGPNCVGVFNGKSRFDTFFQPNYAMSRPKEGNISILAQSATFGLTLLEWLSEEGLGVSKFVSWGNRSDVDEVDTLDYLQKDTETKVIGIHMEGVPRAREFMSVAEKVSPKKPIVALKSGSTERGAKAAVSHTGSMAGSMEVFKGAMKQCGVVVAEDLEQMFDLTKILSLQPEIEGRRIAMVTNGAGPCVAAVDALQDTKLELARLAEDTIDELRYRLPPFCIIDNPLDITGSADAEMYELSLKELAKDENVDILMPFYVFQDGPIAATVDDMVESLKELATGEKPIVSVAAGGAFTKKQQLRFQEIGIPVIPTADRMISALARIDWYRNWMINH